MTTPLNPSTASTGIFLGFGSFYVFMLDIFDYVWYNGSIGYICCAQKKYQKECCTLKKSKKKNGKKYGVASQKTTGKLRIPTPEEVGIMMTWLVEQVYNLLSPIDYVDSPSEKDRKSEELKGMIREKYGDCHVFNTLAARFIPEDAEWLDRSLCLTREDSGVPLETFLVYAKGGNFIKSCDVTTISAKVGIKPNQIEDACEKIAEFLRNKICKMHKNQAREVGVHSRHNMLTNYNYYVDASSGATVNIH